MTSQVKENEQTNIRLLKKTRASLLEVYQIVNDKQIGNRTTNDDIIIEALSLLKKNKKLITSLKLKNLSADDEEEYTFKVFVDKYGPTSWNDFKRSLRRSGSDALKLMKSLGFEI